PTSAFAVPFGPAFDPDGQTVGPPAARSSRLHFLKPLPENFRPDGSSTWIVSTVVPGRLTFVPNVSLTFFGFFDVPASFGVAVTFSDAWSSFGSAIALPTRASEAAATTAAVISLRKFDSP